MKIKCADFGEKIKSLNCETKNHIGLITISKNICDIMLFKNHVFLPKLNLIEKKNQHIFSRIFGV
jgi:hypothetical protein